MESSMDFVSYWWKYFRLTVRSKESNITVWGKTRVIKFLMLSPCHSWAKFLWSCIFEVALELGEGFGAKRFFILQFFYFLFIGKLIYELRCLFSRSFWNLFHDLVTKEFGGFISIFDFPWRSNICLWVLVDNSFGFFLGTMCHLNDWFLWSNEIRIFIFGFLKSMFVSAFH